MSQPAIAQEFQRYGVQDATHKELLGVIGQLFDHMPCCAKIIDEEAFLLSMGAEGRNLMEVEDFEALRGICWLDVWQGEYNTRAIEAFEQAKATGYGVFEGYAPTVKGTPRWWRVQLIRSRVGNKTLYFSLSQDITSERARFVLEDRMTLTQDATSSTWEERVYTLQIDRHGKVLQIDEELAEQIQIEIGHSFFDRLLAEVYDQLLRKMNGEHPERQGAIAHDMMFVRVPGRQHMQVAAEFKPLLSIDGEAVGWSVELLDLRGREGLRQELETLYKLSPGMIFVLSKQGDIVNANPAVHTHLGYTLSDVFKRPIMSLIAPDSLETFDAHMQGDIARDQEHESVHWVRFNHREESRKTQWFALSITRSREGKYDYAYAVDMTEHRLAQEALRKANTSLAERNQYLDMLRHISHHNLQEPIRKLSLYASRMQYLLDDVNSEVHCEEGSNASIDESFIMELRQNAAAVERVAHGMQKQLRALHKYTDTRQERLNLTHVPLSRLVEDAIEMHREFVLEAQEPGEPTSETLLQIEQVGCFEEVLHCDQHLITTMMHYIIDNAHKFADREKAGPPRLQISARKERRGDLENSSQLVIFFKDEGLGVEPRHLKRIIQPFQKVHQRYGGEGMGLALVKRIADNHHASLCCKSDGVGQGFEVEIRFPLSSS